jgi:hypothetical protein
VCVRGGPTVSFSGFPGFGGCRGRATRGRKTGSGGGIVVSGAGVGLLLLLVL